MKMMPKVLLSLSLALMSAAALADEIGFRSPTGNILCLGDDEGVECYIKNVSKITNTKFEGCQMDWGQLFYLESVGRASLVCHGDVPIEESASMRVLPYGKSIKGYGWTCTSQKTGMRCVNRAGRGFGLSRAKQTIF